MQDQNFVSRKNEWEEDTVSVPMNKEDYEAKSGEIGAAIEELAEIEIEKADVAKRLKNAQKKVENLASQIASKQIAKKVPTMWLFNEPAKKKKQIARLESGEIIDIVELDMQPNDFQMELGENANAEGY